MNVAMTIHEFERKYKIIDQDVADLITKELKRRDLPPKSVARNTVYYWRNGKSTPDPLMLEWLHENAENEQARELAGSLLAAMRGNGDDN